MNKIDLLSTLDFPHPYKLKTFKDRYSEYRYDTNFSKKIKQIYEMRNKNDYDNFLIDNEKNFEFHILDSVLFWKEYEMILYPLDIQLYFVIMHILKIKTKYFIQTVGCFNANLKLYSLWIEYYENEKDFKNDVITSKCIFVDDWKYTIEKLAEVVNQIFENNKKIISKYFYLDDECINLNIDLRKKLDEKTIDLIKKYLLRQCYSSSYRFFVSKFDSNYDTKQIYQFGEVVQKDENKEEQTSVEDKSKSDDDESKEKDNKKTSEKIKDKKVYLKDIAGLQSAKDSFYEKVVLPMNHKEIYDMYNKKTGGGILLYGLPGTGKTLFAQAVSNEIDAEFFSIKVSDIESKWVGETERNIRELFEKARKANKAIIFIDEFEAIGGKRVSNTDNYHASNHTVPELLAQMQGADTNNENILVIAATNRPWDIDSALLRPGRFDVKIHVPLPDFEARRKMFEIYLNKIKYENLDFDYLAKSTDGCNGADVKEFVEKLKMEVIHRKIKNKQAQELNPNDVEIVLKSFKPSVTYEDIELIKKFEQKFSTT